MKKMVLLLAMALLSMTAMAQVPREMNYSVMLLNPETGKILSEENAQLRVEIRQGSATGQAVWSQDFNTKTDKNGMCQLTLNFSEDVDWSSGNLFMALIVNGKEMGAPKVASVPYALTAASVEGVLTKKDLVGTWEACRTMYDQPQTYLYTFNDDGTGVFTYGEKSYNISWQLNNIGNLSISYQDYRSNYMDIYATVKITETLFHYNGRVWTKK